MFTLAIPQSEPSCDRNCSISRILLVKIAEEDPAVHRSASRWLRRWSCTEQVQDRRERLFLHNVEAVLRFNDAGLHVAAAFIAVAGQYAALDDHLAAFLLRFSVDGFEVRVDRAFVDAADRRGCSRRADCRCAVARRLHGEYRRSCRTRFRARSGGGWRCTLTGRADRAEDGTDHLPCSGRSVRKTMMALLPFNSRIDLPSVARRRRKR